jgi:hypothetical protein
MKTNLLLFILLVIPAILTAETFYVDPGTGNDINSGLSRVKAWQTLNKVNSYSFSPGDTILFKSGGEWTGILHCKGQGSPDKAIVVDKYGGDKLPLIRGDGAEFPYVIYLDNVQYYEVNNLEITDAGKDSADVKSGVYLYNSNSGTNRHIHLKKLFIHDITGFCNHEKGYGDAINWYCKADQQKTNFDDLLIEDCRIERIERNGIWGWTDHWRRDYWYPSKNVVIRNNYLKDIGLSGIVIIGCDGAITEYNYVERTSLGGDGGIGIWTWSSDKCIVQFNEVTGTYGKHDAQAFDSDWNCRNNIYQYNYSHDNAGGFMLVCTPELAPSNLGCVGTRIRYNLSVNDGAITNIFAIWGPCEDTWIYNNTFYNDASFNIPLVEHGNWNGWATGTHFRNNIFYTEGKYNFIFGESKDNTFSHNLWSGEFAERPDDQSGVFQDPLFRGPGFTKPGDFVLREGSPAAGSGIIIPNNGSRDYQGNMVPANVPPTIGAFEVNFDEALEIHSCPEGSLLHAPCAMRHASCSMPHAPCFQNLFDFKENFQNMSVSNLKMEPVNEHFVKVSKENTDNGFLILTAPNGSWDLTDYNAISINITNLGNGPARISAWTGTELWVDGDVFIQPGESKILEIVFKRKPVAKDEHLSKYFTGMNGLPGGFMWLWAPVDPSEIKSLTLKISENNKGGAFIIGDIRGVNSYNPPTEKILSTSFFPFIDSLGQYLYLDWPGKTYQNDDLKRAVEDETKDIGKFPGPSEWDTYGGWTGGPKSEATGNFRVKKINGQWWLIDPLGNLFWSHGITCVRFNNGASKINGRNHYFKSLPEKGSPLNQFYSFSGNDTAFIFSEANLYRKYGTDWKARSTELAHTRLKSWGMNTMANWSDPEIYKQNNTPYTVAIYFDWPKLGGGSKKFPDVFDPLFRSGLKGRLAEEKDRTTNDPYCIGYFIDNELRWNDLALTALGSEKQLSAKNALVEFLKKKYPTIRDLNNGWNTEFGSWKKLLNKAITSVPEDALPDLHEFDIIIADLYYKVCNEELKAAAPDKLYLGSRNDFHYYPDDKQYEWVIYCAAKYCDVVSFNRYRFSVADLKLPDDIDKPVIIGEFHFGALDRGMPHTGLRSVKDQEQRAEAYISYVEGALKNPSVVGVHWFQYSDQAYTGRSDGENYQIGFVDICDYPYWETIGASRKIGYRLYQTRVSSEQ